MTPVASWTPADYHAAFNRCRQAWERTSPQLTIDGWADMLDGLDEPQSNDGSSYLRFVEPVANPEPPPAAGSPLGADRRNPPRCSVSSAPLSTTTPRPAEPDWDLRGSGQKGA